MNRVTKRVWIVVLFILIQVGGMVFFLAEYSRKAEKWVTFSGSPHVFNKSNLGYGTVVDRKGTLLLDTAGGRTYSKDEALRKATVHWLGDRDGNVSASILAGYVGAMAGYDKVNGIYSYGATQGNAVLTLSSRLQRTAQEALGDRKGTIAVYNYRTGEILCAVSGPNFDPDDPPVLTEENAETYEGVYLNRFLRSTYPPGSIFKLVTTAAALDSVPGITDMTFTCTGTYAYDNGNPVTCEKPHGTKTIKTALASSCNCCFAQITELIGKQKLASYVKKFHAVDSISFDGISTAAGNYDVSNAIPVEFAWSGIGQYTDMINPCTYLCYVGAIAAGGQAAKPYLVERVTVGEDVTYEAQTAHFDRIMPEKIAHSLKSYMRNNVETVYGAENFPGLKVCGKSGTSQLGGGKASNAMFVGFVDDDRYPVAFIAVIEGGGYGSSACVPVLSTVLQECKRVLDAG